MAEYICECGDHEDEKSGVTIKFAEGKAQHQIQCPCEKNMVLKNPKKGAPSFKSNRWGQVF